MTTQLKAQRQATGDNTAMLGTREIPEDLADVGER
jgi:hypothetical protein